MFTNSEFFKSARVNISFLPRMLLTSNMLQYSDLREAENEEKFISKKNKINKRHIQLVKKKERERESQGLQTDHLVFEGSEVDVS